MSSTLTQVTITSAFLAPVDDIDRTLTFAQG